MTAHLLKLRVPLAILGGAILALAVIGQTSAQEADPVEDLTTAIDTGWLMITAFLVFFMQAGFALVEGGFTRAKNTTNILMKNVLDCCMGGIVFYAVGFGLAFGISGESAPGLFGDGNFFLEDYNGYAFWIFQFAFAATAATIVSGSMAERTKFSAYLVYSAFISALIYPIIVHWAWDANGWMSAFNEDKFMANGYLDFAGSGVVHTVGGTAGLMGALVVGPRIGKFNKDGSVNAIPGHNIGIACLGMFILWFGWYGFNPGSTLALTGGFADVAGRVAVTTTLAACAGAVTANFFSKGTTGKWDMGYVVNGALGGLVGITAGCATVQPWAAIIIGAVAAVVVIGVMKLLDALKIDDPVGAVPVHMGGGIWGVLAVGLFTDQDLLNSAYGSTENYGLLLGGGAEQFLAQLIGIAAIVGWTAVTAGALFLAIKFTIGLRVDEHEELAGLDIGEHGMSAYPDFSPSPGSGVFGGVGTVSSAPPSGARPMPESGSAGAS